jgi:hypothetical protein
VFERYPIRDFRRLLRFGNVPDSQNRRCNHDGSEFFNHASSNPRPEGKPSDVLKIKTFKGAACRDS